MGFWLTTAPNPRAPATGVDAGQRGWKRHWVPDANETDRAPIRGKVSLCGIRPAHGWDLDLFIDDKCERCLRKFMRETM